MKSWRIIIKKSIRYSFIIITGASTVASLWGYTVKSINNTWPWWKTGILLLALFVFITICFCGILSLTKHKPYKTTINGKSITIKTGDIFSEKGWKVIPFNDCYDTQVDDIVIAHNTLNGKMIDRFVNEKEELQKTIEMAASDTSSLKPVMSDDRFVYPLGRLISYKEFLMLSFSHFDNQKRAYLGIGEYEQMLIRMWAEMRRVYASKPVAIPLIGTGITTIEGMPEKNYTEILKCILCTLRASGFQPEEGIKIILTNDAMENIDMNIIKEEF